MRTLIFGVKGQLGRDLAHCYQRGHEVRGLDLPELDITDPRSVKQAGQDFKPQLIINAAAYTDVERAEDEEEQAFLANEAGAANVAAMAREWDAPVVYYSTDYVFGGTKSTPYKPEDPINPLGVYARSKAAGETATTQANPHHFVIRTAWLYGPGGNSFVEKIVAAAQTRPSLRVVEDEVGSPTHTTDLAQATLALTGTPAYGVYHAVNAGQCSRYEFAQAILRFAGLDTPVAPCPSSEFPTKAERPLYSVLSNAKLEEACGHIMPGWEESLGRYFQRRSKNA